MGREEQRLSDDSDEKRAPNSHLPGAARRSDSAEVAAVGRLPVSASAETRRHRSELFSSWILLEHIGEER